MKRVLNRHANWVAGVGAVALAVLVGAVAGTLEGMAAAVGVGIIGLAPAIAHVCCVGLRRAITEPTPATVIVLFYLAVFPQRALVIALTGYEEILFVPGPTTSAQLFQMVLLGSAVTTGIVLAFHFFTRRSVSPRSRPRLEVAEPGRVLALGLLLNALALAALALLTVQSGGPAGIIANFGSHDTELATAARSSAYSLWITFAAPAMWSTALVWATRGVKRDLAVLVLVLTAVIVGAQLILFGSRLQLTLGLVGAWAVWYYAGRRVPVKVIAGAALTLVVISIPILAARDGVTYREQTQATHSRVSEIVGYGILDVSLAIRQRPDQIREAWRCEACWAALPWALIPFGPEPDVRERLHTTAIVRNFGAPNQQNSGFPASTVTESWIAGGWLLAPFWALALGGIAGALHLRLVGRDRVHPAALMFYALVVANSFTIFKDGNLNGAVVIVWRTTLYLAIPMILTGVWQPSLLRRRQRRGSPVAGVQALGSART